jgi:hypothetical protein
MTRPLLSRWRAASFAQDLFGEPFAKENVVGESDSADMPGI